MGSLSRRFVWICLAIAIGCFYTDSAYATAGLAEWEITTPGGNSIAHIDPYIQEHGTCLLANGGVVVSRLEWWNYYNGYVAGQTDTGFFLFNERTKQAQTFAKESELNIAVSALKLGNSTSKRLTAQDGWNQKWNAALRASCNPTAEFDKGIETLSEPMRSMVKKQHENQCKQFEQNHQ